jgi:hypothetical protein
LSLRITKEIGADDGNRTRITSLGIKIFAPLYFHNLQNRSGKINVHSTHTVHAAPDLHIAAGRFAGRSPSLDLHTILESTPIFADKEVPNSVDYGDLVGISRPFDGNSIRKKYAS